jgi:hypothetical protein
MRGGHSCQRWSNFVRKLILILSFCVYVHWYNLFADTEAKELIVMMAGVAPRV